MCFIPYCGHINEYDCRAIDPNSFVPPIIPIPGLLYDDTVRVTPLIQEAINRLPEDERNARAFRIKRALDLSLKHRVLPKDQWTTMEQVSYIVCVCAGGEFGGRG